MTELFQLAGQLGGIGGLLAVVIFLMYRQDRKASEKRLTGLLEQDQITRQESTAVMSDLITWLKISGGVR